MFHASLRLQALIGDRTEAGVSLQLGDESIAEVLQALERSDQAATKTAVRATIPDASGAGSDLALDWDADCAGFWVSVDGRSAGFIPFDELRGALGKHLGGDEVPVSVCLQGEVDVWRRGVLSPSQGEVLVYTATQGLGFLGMQAFIVRDGSRCEGFSLGSGDPSRMSLQVPSSEMKGLARARKSVPAIDRHAVLGGMLPQMEPLV